MFSVASASDSFFRASVARTGSVKKKSVFFRTFLILQQRERRQFVFLSVLDVLISIIDILSLAVLLWIIQLYIQPDSNRSFFFFPEWVHKNPIAFIGLFLFLFSLKNGVAFLIAKAQFDFVGSVAVRVSKNNLQQYQNGSFEEFVNIDSSVHVRKIAYQPFDFCQYMLSGMQQTITQLALILIAITAILLFNAQLFLLLLLILLPPVAGVFWLMKKRLAKAKEAIKMNGEKSFQHLMDALKGYVEGNIYDRNAFFLDRFVSYRKKFSKHLFDSMSIQMLPSRLIEVFAVAGLFILIVIARWMNNSDSSSLITIGAFMAAAYKIIPGMAKLLNVTTQIKAYQFSLDEMATKESAPLISQDISDPIQSVQFSGVSFQYKDQPVVNNISFAVNNSDFIGITGKSGKGKTTLFNMLLGFLSPSQGAVFINHAKMTREDLKGFWPRISYVRQQSFFIHDTVLKNITLEEDAYDEDKLNDAIALSGLKEWLCDSPEGISKIITENGRNISGGQQQRIALARALYKDADLFLLDEPFNELDEASEILLLQHFKQLAEGGRIVLMITHRKNALAFCNKIISLDE